MFAKFNDCGPYDYHRDFNLTFPVQLMGDLSYTLGKPRWFGLPQTRFGVRAPGARSMSSPIATAPSGFPTRRAIPSAIPRPRDSTTGASGRSAPTCTWPCDGPLSRDPRTVRGTRLPTREGALVGVRSSSKADSGIEVEVAETSSD